MWQTGLVASTNVGSSWTRDRTCLSCIGRPCPWYSRHLSNSPSKIPALSFLNSNSQFWSLRVQLPSPVPLTLCDPMDCSPPGSSVYGISQERLLVWLPLFTTEPPGKPQQGRLCKHDCSAQNFRQPRPVCNGPCLTSESGIGN